MKYIKYNFALCNKTETDKLKEYPYLVINTSWLTLQRFIWIVNLAVALIHPLMETADLPFITSVVFTHCCHVLLSHRGCPSTRASPIHHTSPDTLSTCEHRGIDGIS